MIVHMLYLLGGLLAGLYAMAVVLSPKIQEIEDELMGTKR